MFVWVFHRLERRRAAIEHAKELNAITQIIVFSTRIDLFFLNRNYALELKWPFLLITRKKGNHRMSVCRKRMRKFMFIKFKINCVLNFFLSLSLTLSLDRTMAWTMLVYCVWCVNLFLQHSHTIFQLYSICWFDLAWFHFCSSIFVL